MSVKLLTEHHLEFLSFKGGCTGSSESTHVGAHLVFFTIILRYVQCSPLKMPVDSAIIKSCYKGTNLQNCYRKKTGKMTI